MRKRPPPGFRPLSPLAVAQTDSTSMRLQSAHEVVEVTVLASDLFRLRVARGRKLSHRPSWAVSKTDWGGVSARFGVQRQGVSIETAKGKLSLSLADGAWRLLAPSGREVLAAVPGGMGFAGDEGRIALRLMENDSLFGLGETTGTFNKRGLRRVFWNSDVLGHAPVMHPGLQNLYVSIPFGISVRDGRAAGLFWDNPARQTWDMGQARLDRWEMRAAAGEVDLYLFLGPLVSDVAGRFADLTGRMPLPPRWGLGYHQCRYSYESAAQIERLARTFRRKQIPCDAIYLDIHHMDGYRVFSFGKSFPKPARLMASLARRGFRVVAIVDPGVKDEAGFGVLKRGKQERAFVKDPSGKKDYIGKVWPGRVRFPDFTNGRVRAWWGKEQARLQKIGVAGFWNDMNEPANFALPSKTLPENCVHDSDSGMLRHAVAHNVYGMEMARASREGAFLVQPDTRPFVITRAGYAGVQRHALVWTGDNSSAWEHLADSIQMLLNLSLSGVPFCGSDVGGFMDHATGELLARWTQMAAFTPFFRNHSNLGSHAQEPWAYGSRVEAICRRSIGLRYQLLPYLYRLFIEAHRLGTPIMRPLLWHYQGDPVAVAVDDQFLLGHDLLVAPVIRQGARARSVYLPHGNWFDFWTGETHSGGRHVLAEAGLERIPVYVRAGSLIPMVPVRQHIERPPPATMNLHLWGGAAGDLQWYEDDGQSLGYARGEVHERSISFSKRRGESTLRFSEARGRFQTEVETWRIIVRTANRAARVVANGRPVRSRFDPRLRLQAFELPNSAGTIEVCWA